MRRHKILDNIKYEFIRVIAQGGMGTVYEAYQHGTDGFKKIVAIKIIKEEYSHIKAFRNNFIGEAKLVADLIHSNIVQMYHLGTVDGHYYMVMEYVNGHTLEDFIIRHLETKQQIPIDLAVFIVSRVCRGLSYAHQKKDEKGRDLKIVHRDVNPKNIMLAYEGDVKLTDFGIAKARDLMYNKEGEVIAGKDEYLSPEQAHKQVTDGRADIFSCGIILSELILGYHIYEGNTPEETRNTIAHADPPDFRPLKEGISQELNTIMQKALARDKKNRYGTASEMLTALETYMYTDRYGPTNEKLAIYVNDLFSKKGKHASLRWKELFVSAQTR